MGRGAHIFFPREMLDLEALVRPVVETSGLELVDVSFGRESGRRVLRVVVDREGGVDLDAIAQASEQISRRLDLEGFAEGEQRYTLEVSSPGVERPLKRPEDFVRRIGEKVRIKTFAPVDEARTHVGTIAAADEATVTVATEAGERTLRHDDISSARTVFEWGPAPRKGKR